MKISFKLVLSAMAYISITACQTSSNQLSAKDREEITLSSNQWVETYNKNDWKALSLLFAAEATMMPPNSEEVQGRQAIAAWEAENESGFRIAFDIQEIEGSGNIAYVRGRSCVFIPGEDGTFMVDVGKFLEVRKKQPNGEWLIEADVFNSDAALGSALRESCPFEQTESII